MARWFTQKYALPTTHDAYLRRCHWEWLEEMYIDFFYEQGAAVEAYKRVGTLGLQPREQEIERGRLKAEILRLADVLKEPPPLALRDDKLDDIDDRLAAGEKVDLSSLLPKGMKIREG